MKLGEIKPAEKKQTRTRVGRGIGSGLGKTSGKGHKGQKARTGASIRRGFEGGQTPLYRRLPKRGFTNIHAKKYTEVTLTMLNKSQAEEVSAESLLKEGIITKLNDGIVILGTGSLDKKLTVKANRFTKTAKEKIESVGRKDRGGLIVSNNKKRIKDTRCKKKIIIYITTNSNI